MSERAKILGEMCFDENLVAMHVNAVDDQDAIDQVAKVMLREGMVKDSYPDAVKAREKVLRENAGRGMCGGPSQSRFAGCSVALSGSLRSTAPPHAGS